MDPNFERELGFYLVAVIAAVIVIIPSIISAKKEHNKNYALLAWLLPTLGAIMTFTSNHYAHKQGIRDQDTIDSQRVFIRRQFKAQGDSSHKIIDSLDTAVSHANKLIMQNNEIIHAENSSFTLLHKQLIQSSKIQGSVVKTGQRVITNLDKVNGIINNNLTGGNAYGMVLITSSGKRNFHLMLFNHFDHLIPKINITTIDYDALMNCKRGTFATAPSIDKECFLSHSYPASFAPLDVDANQFLPSDPRVLLDVSGKIRRLEFYIYTPSHQFDEQLIYQAIDDKIMAQRYRVLELINKRWVVVENSKQPLGLSMFPKLDRYFPLPMDMSFESF